MSKGIIHSYVRACKMWCALPSPRHQRDIGGVVCFSFAGVPVTGVGWPSPRHHLAVGGVMDFSLTAMAANRRQIDKGIRRESSWAGLAYHRIAGHTRPGRGSRRSSFDGSCKPPIPPRTRCHGTVLSPTCRPPRLQTTGSFSVGFWKP